MDDLIDDLTRIGRRCERAAKGFVTDGKSADTLKRIATVAGAMGDAWCGSWIGYQSHVYTAELTAKRPGDHIDTTFGQSYRGNWAEFSYEAIRDTIYERAGVAESDIDHAISIGNDIIKISQDCLAELLPTLDAVLSVNQDTVLKDRRDALAKTSPQFTPQQYLEVARPKGGSVMTSDMRAIQGGMQSPPHLGVLAHFLSLQSAATQAGAIAEHTTYITRYLQKAMKMKGTSAAKTEGPIFIGHGGAGDWKELRDFLRDRLHLQFEEFNRVPTAGRSTKERLLEMLDRCPFAFLVMTAEDEQADGTFQARANVVHEVGLFQGRYGFERAIILLEKGCSEFSNVNSIGQIRFEKGDIKSTWEEVRRVLEREKII